MARRSYSAHAGARRQRVLTVCFCLMAAAFGCGDEKKARESDREMQDVPRADASESSRGTGNVDDAARDEPAPDGEVSEDAAMVTSQARPADAAVAASDAGAAGDHSLVGEDAGPVRDVDATVSVPPSVQRGDPKATYWDLRVRGVGLERFEGRQVVIRLGRIEAADERLAAGSAHIANGSFELFFPQVWESGLYKLKRAYIDVNGNGRCDSEQDLVFVDARAAKIEVLELRVDSATTRADFAHASAPDEECAALNASWPAPETEAL